MQYIIYIVDIQYVYYLLFNIKLYNYIPVWDKAEWQKNNATVSLSHLSKDTAHRCICVVNISLIHWKPPLQHLDKSVRATFTLQGVRVHPTPSAYLL